jgi:hypothetical protein
MRVIRYALSGAAVVAFSFAWLFYLMIDNGRSFLFCALLAALGVALLLLAWVIMVHGDLKQRTDGCVAVFTSIVLLAMALAALGMYDNDYRISAECLENPDAAAVCSDKLAMAQHDQNAATLLQIWSLMAFGQIVPLLSVLKDAVYCWLKPTPWQETSHPWADNRRVRQENRFRVLETDTPVEP